MELGALGMAPWGAIGKATGRQTFPDLYCHYDVVAEVLGKMGVPPDFESDANLRYTHRRDGRTEIYFVANPADRQVLAHCLFRVTGKQPEVWDPMTGAMHMVRTFEEKDGRTRMELPLEPGGSVFVVFRKSGHSRNARAIETPRSEAPAPIEIRGPWQVQFQPGRGAPETNRHGRTHRLVETPGPGRQVLQRSSHVPDALSPGIRGSAARTSRWMLDLGQVEVMARVTLNGKDLGVLWKKPFQVEITGAVQPGVNTLEVTVANLWPNRLIGDQSLPPDQRITWTTWNPFKKETPLLESGLLGPVLYKKIPAAK